MKYSMYLAFLLSFLVCAMSSDALSKSDDQNNGLPSDWYSSPEDNFLADSAESTVAFEKTAKLKKNNKILDRIRERRRNRNLARSGKKVEELFSATNQSLLNFDQKMMSSEHRRDRKWKLSDLVIQLGVGIKGGIGVLAGKGSASTQVYWKKKEDSNSNKKSARQRNNFFEKTNFPEISEKTSKADLESLVEDVVDATMATERIEDEELFKSGLYSKIAEFHDLVKGISPVSGQKWKVSKYVLALSVKASGMVSAGVAVGGDIRLKFTFKNSKINSGSRSFGSGLSADVIRQRSELTRLLSTISDDFSRVNEIEIAKQKFKLKGFKISIGLSVGGSIGVVKAGAKIMGHVVFKRVPVSKKGTTANSLAKTKSSNLLKTIPMIDNSKGTNSIEFAKSKGIAYKTSNNSDSKVFSVKRDSFRNGIQRAFKIAGFLAKRGRRFSRGEWVLYKIKPQFTFSIGGSLSMVTLAGHAVLELDLQR